MEIDEMLKLNSFWKQQRRIQANSVVELQAPTIAKYFEGLQKVNDEDKYKVMILELIDELTHATDELQIRKIIDGYKRILDSYKERIAKVRAGSKDIVLVDEENANIEKTEKLMKPVEVIYNFIDTLLYGGYDIEKIQTYLKMWKEKSKYNILEPANIMTSENGRHANNPYKKVGEQVEQEEK